MPDTSIKESKERVRTAIKNSGLEFPSRRIVVNLAPADSKKEGAFFDLPIAIGILVATEAIACNDIDDYVFIGELSLDGKIRKVNGILPMCIEAKRLGIKKIILPEENANEASVVVGIDILPVKNLIDVISYLNGVIVLEKAISNVEELFRKSKKHNFDFSEVKGQENIKRALEVSASGGHNCLLIRKSSVHGKTMLARRLPGILPDLTFEESLEITKIHSIAGILKEDNALITERPFRSPHNTVSNVSLIGGGAIPKPGEISLSHYGVLFLDELPEFNKSTLELMRQPLEDGKVTISRVNATLTYPCNFMFVSSMNPCPCGYFGSTEKECTCRPEQISKYMGKISGPLLDRIDMHLEVTPVKYAKLGEASSRRNVGRSKKTSK